MYKKSMICLIALVGLLQTVISQTETVNFESGMSWKQILKQARAEHKPIFVDCYATWCGPCKEMDKNIYTHAGVAKYYNANFICVKMQMDTSAKDQEDVKKEYADASEIKKTYGVNAYPSFLFFSAEGKALDRNLGYQDTSGMIKMAEKAMLPGEQYYTLLERYKTHQLGSPKEYLGFAKMASAIQEYKMAHQIANDYINSLSLQDLMTVDNIEFMYYNTAIPSDRGFTLFRDSGAVISKIDKRMTPGVCHDLPIRVIGSIEISPFETSHNGKPDYQRIQQNLIKYGALGEETYKRYEPGMLTKAVIVPAMTINPDWGATLQLIKQQNLGGREKYLVGSAIVFYERQLKQDPHTACTNFIKACALYAEIAPDIFKSPQANEFAYTVFEHDSVAADLKMALAWSKYSIDSADTNDRFKPEYLDTYSSLLYKLGNTREAIAWEQKAAAAGAIRNPKDSVFLKTIEKMQNGQPTW